MSENENNFNKWFNNAAFFSAHAEFFTDEKIPKANLINVLGLDKDNLKPYTKDLIDFLNTEESFEKLIDGYHCYYQFQDILAVGVNEKTTNMFNRHYCYYESLVYLRESIISWLDGNLLASFALIRPFVELSILHIYWYIKSENTSDYTDYYQWINSQTGKPPYKNQIEFIFNNIKTSKGLEKRISYMKTMLLNIYKTQSAYQHTPKLDETVVNLNKSTDKISIVGLYAYSEMISMLLKQIVFLYILIYPMSIFPVDKYKKWGVGGPIGLFMDFSSYYVIKKYISNDNIENLKNHLKDHQTVQDLTEWFNSQPKLTEVEIEETWQSYMKNSNVQNDTTDEILRYTHAKSHSRALGWFMNYFNQNPKKMDLSDSQTDYLQEILNNWPK